MIKFNLLSEKNTITSNKTNVPDYFPSYPGKYDYKINIKYKPYNLYKIKDDKI